jgi:RNA polymerase sigma factor (sigma-70 family)
MWQQLIDRHQWQLVVVDDQLISETVNEYAAITTHREPAQRARTAIQRIYSIRLYLAIRHGEERAAQELWLLFLRLALRSGASEADAADLAQEATTRVLEKCATVHSPSGFLTWAMLLFRTVQRDLGKKLAVPQSAPSDDQPALAEIPDASDHIAKIESLLIQDELRVYLRAIVTNDLERFTLLRHIVFGDEPRDVAKALGLPLYRTRVAKARALQRLRDNAAFMAFIETLRNNTLVTDSPTVEANREK